MDEPVRTSTLKRPAERLLRQATGDGGMSRDTMELYLRKGWWLALCCRDCPRIVEWPPPKLLEMFGDKLTIWTAAWPARAMTAADPRI